MKDEQPAVLTRQPRHGAAEVDEIRIRAERGGHLDAVDRASRAAERPPSLVEEAAHEDATRPGQHGGIVMQLPDLFVDARERVPYERVGLAGAAGKS